MFCDFLNTNVEFWRLFEIQIINFVKVLILIEILALLRLNPANLKDIHDFAKLSLNFLFE